MRSISTNNPILFHTDLSKIDRSTLKTFNRQKSIIPQVYLFLKSTFPDQELWFPAFNYDFMATRVFNPAEDRIQVGVLNEWLRNLDEFVRSRVPVFSIIRSRSSNPCSFRSVVNPFDCRGEFAEIRDRSGFICFFGASINSLTFIHYVENLIKVPYRYLKEFRGKIIQEAESKDVLFSYLVRPAGLNLSYDWLKINRILQDAEISFKIKTFGNYEIYDAKVLTEFMIEQYTKDIFWTLTSDSEIQIRKKLENLGRKFNILDFELEKHDE